MNFANIELEKNENIAIVLIHRPQVLNALDTPTLKELETIFGDLEADETVRVIIITGSGRNQGLSRKAQAPLQRTITSGGTQRKRRDSGSASGRSRGKLFSNYSPVGRRITLMD